MLRFLLTGFMLCLLLSGCAVPSMQLRVAAKPKLVEHFPAIGDIEVKQFVDLRPMVQKVPLHRIYYLSLNPRIYSGKLHPQANHYLQHLMQVVGQQCGVINRHAKKHYQLTGTLYSFMLAQSLDEATYRPLPLDMTPIHGVNHYTAQIIFVAKLVRDHRVIMTVPIHLSLSETSPNWFMLRQDINHMNTFLDQASLLAVEQMYSQLAKKHL